MTTAAAVGPAVLGRGEVASKARLRGRASVAFRRTAKEVFLSFFAASSLTTSATPTGTGIEGRKAALGPNCVGLTTAQVGQGTGRLARGSLRVRTARLGLGRLAISPLQEGAAATSGAPGKGITTTTDGSGALIRTRARRLIGSSFDCI